MKQYLKYIKNPNIVAYFILMNTFVWIGLKIPIAVGIIAFSLSLLFFLLLMGSIREVNMNERIKSIENKLKSYDKNTDLNKIKNEIEKEHGISIKEDNNGHKQ